MCIYHVQIQNASSSDQLQDMLWSDNFSFVMDCGFVKPTTTVTMEDIPALVQAVFLEYVLLRSTQEIAQFIEGLETLGIATLLRRHPRCLKKLLVHDPSEARVTVQYLSRLLSPILSPRGHNRREQEEAALLTWSEYLQDIEGTHVHARVLWNLKLKFNRIILTDMT